MTMEISKAEKVIFGAMAPQWVFNHTGAPLEVVMRGCQNDDFVVETTEGRLLLVTPNDGSIYDEVEEWIMNNS